MVFQLIRWMTHLEGLIQPIDSVPHTAFYNTDTAHLILGNSSTALAKGVHDVPKYIQLHAQFKGKLCYNSPPVTLAYVEHDHLYESVELYPPGILQDWYYEFIDLYYLGIGDYFDFYPSEVRHSFKGDQLPWGTLSLTTSLLYRHAFKTQKTNLILHKRKDAQEVRGYGGYWRQGCSLEHIQQAFFTAGFEGENSSFYLSTLADWREKNINPSQIKHQDQSSLEFIECEGESFKNLHEVLRSGGSQFQLTSRTVLSQREKVYEYRSIDAVLIGQDQLQIVYIKGE